MSQWVKIRSFHLGSGLVSRGGMVHTMCGKWAAKDAESASTPPVNEKSCERCYQLREQGNR